MSSTPHNTSELRVSRRDCPSPHSAGTQAARALWGLVRLTLFLPSPPPYNAWRRMLLRLFGARIGRGVKIMPTARIFAPWRLTMEAQSCLGHHVDCYNLGGVTIGRNATVSQYSFLCGATHDHTDPTMPLLANPITIGANAWVCADVFVGPGVTIGEGSIVGARSSVFSDLPGWKICHGTPATVRDTRELKTTLTETSRESR